MNRQSLSNMDKVAILLIILGTVMLVAGGFSGRTDTQIAGLIMWVGGGLQLMSSRIRRMERQMRHHH